LALLDIFKKKKPRSCVVGIDGLPCTLLKRFCESGITPRMAELVKAGHLRQMTVTLPEISAVSWPSFMTGSNPGTHGIFGFTDLKSNTYDIVFPAFRDLKAPTFWDKLGEKGKRSIVINQPGTYPARDIPGVLISGFVAIDLVKAVRPPSWIGRIKRLNYQIDIDTQRSRKDHKFLFRELDRTLEGRRRAAFALWDEEDWDYFQVVITGTDRLQHYLWAAIEDEGHEFHTAAMNYYRAVDQFVGEIHDRYLKMTGESGPGVNFFMMSDHGFCGIRQEVYLNAWLKEYGFLSYSFHDHKEVGDISDKTQAFALDPGRIYIHRKGRYPRGSVSDDAAGEIIEKIVAGLGALEYNGEKVIQAVHRADEIYSGPEIGRAPDLIVTPVDGFDLKGSVAGEDIFRRTDLTGMHTWDDAFFWSSFETPDKLDITQLANIVTRALV